MLLHSLDKVCYVHQEDKQGTQRHKARMDYLWGKPSVCLQHGISPYGISRVSTRPFHHVINSLFHCICIMCENNGLQKRCADLLVTFTGIVTMLRLQGHRSREWKRTQHCLWLLSALFIVYLSLMAMKPTTSPSTLQVMKPSLKPGSFSSTNWQREVIVTVIWIGWQSERVWALVAVIGV